eukprot:3287527-Amphidinium_carterae.1
MSDSANIPTNVYPLSNAWCLDKSMRTQNSAQPNISILCALRVFSFKAPVRVLSKSIHDRTDRLEGGSVQFQIEFGYSLWCTPTAYLLWEVIWQWIWVARYVASLIGQGYRGTPRRTEFCPDLFKMHKDSVERRINSVTVPT